MKVMMLLVMSLLFTNGWRYGLVNADHYRPIEERNIIQLLLTIPLVSVSFLSVGGKKLKQNGKFNRRKPYALGKVSR